MGTSSEEAFNDWLRLMQQGMSESQGELLKRMQPALAAFAGFGASAAAVAAKSISGQGKQADLGEAGLALEKFLNAILTGGFADTGFGKGAPLPALFEQLGPLSVMFGPGQILKDRLVRLQSAYERYQKATQAYTKQCTNFGPEVVERFTAKTLAAGEKAAQTPEAAFESLMSLADHALEDFSERESYRKAAAEMLNASVALTQTWRDCWDETCEQLDLPNRAQIETLRKENQALTERLEQLEQRLASSSQQEKTSTSDGTKKKKPRVKKTQAKAAAQSKRKKTTTDAKPARKASATSKKNTQGFDIASLGAISDEP